MLERAQEVLAQAAETATKFVDYLPAGNDPAAAYYAGVPSPASIAELVGLVQQLVALPAAADLVMVAPAHEASWLPPSLYMEDDERASADAVLVLVPDAGSIDVVSWWVTADHFGVIVLGPGGYISKRWSLEHYDRGLVYYATLKSGLSAAELQTQATVPPVSIWKKAVRMRLIDHKKDPWDQIDRQIQFLNLWVARQDLADLLRRQVANATSASK